MIIEKGKTLNGYAISVLFMKNNADLWLSGRYFFMEITKSNRTIIKQIMYSLSIAVTSFLGDDGITAQLLHCFKSYLYRIAPTSTLYTIYLYISSSFSFISSSEFTKIKYSLLSEFGCSYVPEPAHRSRRKEP